MFVLEQVSREKLPSDLLSDFTQVIPGYSVRTGLGKATLPITQNLLDCHFLSFLTLRHLEINVAVSVHTEKP